MRAEHDPIEQVKSRILDKRYGTEESLKQVEAEVRAIITEAADFATSDPEPDAAELWTDIYAEA
jgi:pyruvate dehydrogenase E1 component alpha subunit